MSDTQVASAEGLETPSYPMPRACPFDPAAELDRLRRDQPLTRVRIWDDTEPWLVTRYDDLRALMSDTRLSADTTLPGFPPFTPSAAVTRKRAPTFTSMDGPRHAYLRRMLISEFSVRRMDALRPRMVQLVDDLLEDIAQRPQPVDFYQEFALAVPSNVICWILGVPYEDHVEFEQYARLLINHETSSAEAARVDDALNDYLRRLVRVKSKHPTDDILSRLVLGRLLTGELTEDQLVGMANLLLIAGHETTANQIALGIIVLLEHPAAADELRSTQDPDLIASASEEMLRYMTILQTGRRRVALADIEMRGQTIRAGDGVILAGDAANRDEAVFPDPDTFDIHRNSRGHVALGFGPHQCLGQSLVRVELETVFPRLLRRFPDLRLAVPFEQVDFKHYATPVFGVNSLPLVWGNES